MRSGGSRAAVVGLTVGLAVGWAVGLAVGLTVGLAVGLAVGRLVDASVVGASVVGALDGADWVGGSVGAAVGSDAVGLAVGGADVGGVVGGGGGTQSASKTPSGSRTSVVTAGSTPQSQGTLVKGLSLSHLEEGRGCGCAKRGGAVEWRGSAASTGRDGGQRA